MESIECMTFKTGKCIFSCAYDTAEIQPKHIEAHVLYGSVLDLPILPNIAARIKEDLIRRSIFGTAAIEGNRLTEEGVGQVLAKTSREALLDNAEREIGNLKAMYRLLGQGGGGSDGYSVDEALIKGIHEGRTRDLDYYHNVPGAYRNEIVKVGDANHGGVYTPPKTLADIEMLMTTFVRWINSEEMLGGDQLLRGALAHYYLAKIHPFQDGNGRTARFVDALILDRAGFHYLPQAMSNYYYRHLDDYFFAFSLSQQKKDRSDITPFVALYLDGVIHCVTEIKDQVIFAIRRLTLKDFYDFQRTQRIITQRQHDLLHIQLETFTSFSLLELFSNPIFKHLYAHVSESTARRDIKKLRDMGYIRKKEDSEKYEINLRFLG